jgi:uncharacterized BrkB/YihY/UPF0761 family membrane protein
MSFEDEYAVKPKKKNPINAFLPLIGLFLIAAAGGIGFVLSGPVTQSLQTSILASNADDIAQNYELVQLIVGVVIAIVILLFVAMIYAMFAPKPTKLTSEKELQREKEERLAEQLARKRRKQEVNRKMAAELKQKLEKPKK